MISDWNAYQDRVIGVGFSIGVQRVPSHPSLNASVKELSFNLSLLRIIIVGENEIGSKFRCNEVTRPCHRVLGFEVLAYKVVDVEVVIGKTLIQARLGKGDKIGGVNRLNVLKSAIF